MTDDLDAKIARLGARVQSRAEDTRAKLQAMGALEIAEALRDVFGARCVYLGSDAGYPHGQLFNFDLRPNHVATDPADRFTESAEVRPSNLPYRGKAHGKRKGRRAQKPDRQRDPPKTWHDLS